MPHKLRLSNNVGDYLNRARIKCGRGTRTADRRNCGLSPADWPKIFDSSPQFLHRVAVRSPRIIRGYSIPYRHVYALVRQKIDMGMESADTSPQFILSGPHFQSLHSAGESPQFLLSAVRGPRPHFILALSQQGL
ncbi:uncharacterized protein LOC123469597 [Daphnia magna]|uniref:uncharacterized protein LOC123469597 n=1 Tax=Daphnia magna TaxID=35525 RepID=UPI001E1BA72E|nr:uncharacterized protein LOC123469597 [Daphnia magna]